MQLLDVPNHNHNPSPGGSGSGGAVRAAGRRRQRAAVGGGAAAAAETRRRQRAAARTAGGAYVDDADGMPVFRTHAQLAEEFYRDALVAERRLRLCLNCEPDGLFYREIDNVGRLACRYHPGALDNGRLACCGHVPGDVGARRARGCRPCDHSLPPTQADLAEHGRERWPRALATRRVPLHLLHLYAPRPDAVLERHVDAAAPHKSWAAVLRVEPDAY